MPIYEYRCRQCDHDFELLIRGNEQPTCPSCSQPELEKQFSVPAAHSARSSQLPIRQSAPSGGCGLPQCGMGGCQMD